MIKHYLSVVLALIVILTSVPAVSTYANEIAEAETGINYDIGEAEDVTITEEQHNYGFTIQEIIDGAEEIEINKEIGVPYGDGSNRYLKFQINNPGAVFVDFRGNRYFGYGAKYFLYNENKEFLVKGTSYSYSAASYRLEPIGLTAGTYYISVEFDWRAKYDTSLTVRYTQSDSYEQELNDSIATANNIELNKAVTGGNRDYYNGEKDYYCFNLSEKGEVYVSWQGDVEFSNICIVTMYDSKQKQIWSKKIKGTDDDPLLSKKTELDAGKYYLCIEARGTSDDKYEEYTFKINYNPSVPVTGILLNKSSASILIGDELALDATIVPFEATNKNVSWASSDEDVATVTSEGLIMGINAGTATITAKTADENIFASCKVIVVNPKPTAPTISSVTNLEKGLKIKWSKVSNVAGYQVYRSKNGGVDEQIASVKGTIYTDNTANTNGAKYVYKIYSYTQCDGQVYKSGASSAKISYRLSKSKVKSVKNSAPGTLAVAWVKNAKVSGYQIQYSTNKDFKNVKTVTVTSTKTVSKRLTELRKGKTYYVRVRPYKKANSIKCYGVWNKYSKGVKVKK